MAHESVVAWEANTFFDHRYADPKILRAVLADEMDIKQKDIELRITQGTKGKIEARLPKPMDEAGKVVVYAAIKKRREERKRTAEMEG